MKNRKFVMLSVVSMLVLAAGAAFAFTASSAAGFATGLGYNLYNIVVNQVVMGPIGTAGGVVMLAGGAIGAAMGKLSAAMWPLLGGGLLIAAPSIATGLGMLF